MREIKLIHKGVHKFKKRLGHCPNCFNYAIFLPATLGSHKKFLCRCGFYFPMKDASNIILDSLTIKHKFFKIIRKIRELFRWKRKRKGT